MLRFDIYELDVRAGELRKWGKRLRLQGQPLQVLATLLKRAGDLVTREELRAEIWPADTFVDFDHSLHNAIARIRDVLGDSAENPRYIETLPRRGYRYIGAVDNAPPPLAPAETVEPALEAARFPAARGWRRPLAVIVCALLLCAFFALVFFASTSWRPVRAKTAALPIHSIAVLPLS